MLDEFFRCRLYEGPRLAMLERLLLNIAPVRLEIDVDACTYIHIHSGTAKVVFLLTK